MNAMNRLALGTTVAAAASACAQAASAATLVVSFTPAAAAVPLSPAMMAVLGIVMAVGAIVVMRRRGAGNGLAFGMAAMIGLATFGMAGGARAVEAFSLTGPSPQTFTLMNFGGTTTITNNVGVSVVLNSLVADSGYIVIPGSCTIGAPLAAGASCAVTLVNAT